MTRPADLFAKARSQLLVSAPFWGVLALRLTPIEDPAVARMETDGVSIRYNPDFVVGLPAAQLRTIIAHETMHCAALHHTRRAGRDPKRWNRACDYAINPLLRDADFDLPDWALADPAFAGLSAEEIYDRLPEDSTNAASPDDTGMGEVTDPPPDQDDATGSPAGAAPSADALAQQEAAWSIAVAQAEATAKAMGAGAGDAARALKDQIAPRVDWRSVLRRYLSQAAKSDYSWTPPNRRHIAQGLYLPSLRSERLGPVVIGVDTSGSIDGPTLAGFSAEIGAILAEAEPELIHVVYCDAAVAGTQTFAAGEDFRLTPRGGRGTAFRPVFDWVAASEVQPACIIYLTDLEGDDFGAPPDCPVLWVSTGRGTAPFGEVIALR